MGTESREWYYSRKDKTINNTKNKDIKTSYNKVKFTNKINKST